MRKLLNNICGKVDGFFEKKSKDDLIFLWFKALGTLMAIICALIVVGDYFPNHETIYFCLESLLVLILLVTYIVGVGMISAD